MFQKERRGQEGNAAYCEDDNGIDANGDQESLLIMLAAVLELPVNHLRPPSPKKNIIKVPGSFGWINNEQRELCDFLQPKEKQDR